MRVAMRAAAVTLLNSYKAAHDDALRQVYRARPMTIMAPCAFIDNLDESEISYTPAGTHRNPVAAIRLVKGVYDSGESVDGQDELVDGFIAHVVANRHAAGANTLVLVDSVADDDAWVPDWIDNARSYYSSLVTLRGEGIFGGLT